MVISKGLRTFVKVLWRLWKFCEGCESFKFAKRNFRLQYLFLHLISLWWHSLMTLVVPGIVFITISLALLNVGKPICQLWNKSFIKICFINAKIEGKAAIWTWSHPIWPSLGDTWDTESSESGTDHLWCSKGPIPSLLFGALVTGKATLRGWGKHIHGSNGPSVSNTLSLFASVALSSGLSCLVFKNFLPLPPKLFSAARILGVYLLDFISTAH